VGIVSESKVALVSFDKVGGDQYYDSALLDDFYAIPLCFALLCDVLLLL
jgi:hypothetical protein